MGFGPIILMMGFGPIILTMGLGPIILTMGFGPIILTMRFGPMHCSADATDPDPKYSECGTIKLTIPGMEQVRYPVTPNITFDLEHQEKGGNKRAGVKGGGG